MKIKYLVFVLVSFTLVVLSGCSLSSDNTQKKQLSVSKNQAERPTENQNKNAPKKQDIMNLGWEFRYYNKKDTNEFSYPYTEVSLIVKSDKEEKIKIGNYIGHA